MQNDLHIRVYYEDTDAGGVVYHSNYLNFAERARTELLRERGFSQAVMLEDDLAFVVRNIDISYRFPAYLDDLLVVQTNITELKRASLVFNQSIFHEDGRLLATLDVKIACIKLAQKKPCAIPTEIIRKLTSGSC